MMARISGSSLPFLNSFTGGSRRPSCSTAVGSGREAARHRAADVGPVAGVGQPAEQLAVAIDRHHEAHIHQMRAAEIGIVDDIDVARLQACRQRPSAIISMIVLGRILHRRRRRPAGPARPARSASRSSADDRCRRSGRCASAITGEKAARQKARSISSQICCSAGLDDRRG